MDYDVKVTLLLSGGIDSSVLLAFYLRQQLPITALFIDYGQPAAQYELEAASSISEFYDVPLLTYVYKCNKSFSSGETIGRNAFLIFAATLSDQICSSIISLAIHAGTTYYDCSRSFIKEVQAILDGYTEGRTNITAPFIDWSKRLIWKLGKKYEVPFDLTYSCETGELPGCGRCLSCKEREALDLV